MYKNLQFEKINATAEKLKDRIQERFPNASLKNVAEEILQIASKTQETLEQLKKPIWYLRVLNIVLLGGLLFLLFYIIRKLGYGISGQFNSLTQFIQLLEPALGCMVYLGAFVLFIWTMASRLKRKKAFKALHELRSLAHVIDMHQLTKDPALSVFKNSSTKSSPKRTLTPFELNRYFDYCTELLSLLSKISALYAQSFTDPEIINNVDQVEQLTTGLAQKVWQKMIVLDHYVNHAQKEKQEENKSK